MRKGKRTPVVDMCLQIDEQGAEFALVIEFAASVVFLFIAVSARAKILANNSRLQQFTDQTGRLQDAVKGKPLVFYYFEDIRNFCAESRL